MKRLQKKADNVEDISVEFAEKAIEGIDLAIENILESYKELFNRLNTLYEEYPRLHKNIVRVVKFPNEYDIREVAEMQVNLNKVKNRLLQDKDYLKENM